MDIHRAFVDGDDEERLTIDRLQSGSREYPSENGGDAAAPCSSVCVWLSPLFDQWPLSPAYWDEQHAAAASPSSSLASADARLQSPSASVSSPSASMTRNNGEVRASFKFVHCIAEHEPAFLEATERMIRTVHKKLRGQILISVSKQLTITTARDRRRGGGNPPRGAPTSCTRFLLVSIHWTPLSLAMHKKLPGHQRWCVSRAAVPRFPGTRSPVSTSADPSSLAGPSTPFSARRDPNNRVKEVSSMVTVPPSAPEDTRVAASPPARAPYRDGSVEYLALFPDPLHSDDIVSWTSSSSPLGDPPGV